TSALTYATVLSLLRHPNIRLQLLMPFFFAVVFFLPATLGASDDGPAPSFIIGFFVYMVMANAALITANVFGADPEGFQALVLLPTERKRYLIAKNLALLPPIAAQLLLFTTAGLFLYRPNVITTAILPLQFAQIYATVCVAGNIMSIYF